MLKRLRVLLRAKDGMAAVEFAFLAPIMVLLFFGTLELSAALDCRSRVSIVASTAADLVAQETTVSTTDMNNVFAALNTIIYPYNSAPAKIVISSIVDNGAGVDKVAWSNAQNATARTVGSVVTVPAGLITPNSGGGVILAEITYSFAPTTTVYLGNALSMTSSFYAHPRRSLTVIHS